MIKHKEEENNIAFRHLKFLRISFNLFTLQKFCVVSCQNRLFALKCALCLACFVNNIRNVYNLFRASVQLNQN